MRTGFLRDLYRCSPPFITVWMDTTYDTEDARHQVRLRWRGAREVLAADGAAEDELRRFDDAVGPAGLPGDQSQLLVGAEGQVVFGEHLPTRPPRDLASRSALPLLYPWLMARSRTWVHPYLLVVADRHGADIYLRDLRRRQTGESVQDEEYPDRKVHEGGWSEPRYERAAQENWERAAKEVAQAVDRLRRRYRPDMIVLSGDPRARSVLMERLPMAALGITVEVGEIERAAGASVESLARQVEEVLAAGQEAEAERHAERFEEARAHERAAEGLDNVIGALVRGGVDTLLVSESFPDGDAVWVGPEPLQIGVRGEELTAMGVAGDEVTEQDTGAAVVRSLVMNDGEFVSVDADRLPMRDGVGAVLRYVDRTSA